MSLKYSYFCSKGRIDIAIKVLSGKKFCQVTIKYSQNINNNLKLFSQNYFHFFPFLGQGYEKK